MNEPYVYIYRPCTLMVQIDQSVSWTKWLWPGCLSCWFNSALSRYVRRSRP